MSVLQRFIVYILRSAATVTRRNTLDPEKVKSLLLVELTGLGDLIVMLGSIASLRDRFNNAEVTLLVAEAHAPLLAQSSLNVHICAVPPVRTIAGLIRAVRAARLLRIDLAISMSTPRKNTIVTLLSGARAIAGYLQFRDTITPYLQETPVEAFGIRLVSEERYGRESLAVRPGKIIRAFAAIPAQVPFQLALDANAAASTSLRLRREGIIPETPYIVIHPFSSWRYRSWSPRDYLHLGDVLSSTFQMPVVFQYAKNEEHLWGNISPGRTVRCFASSDLFESAVVLHNAALFIGNDSGPLHLASALGLCTVGLYGPASPLLTGPQTTCGKTVFHEFPCSPCDQRACVRQEHPCMESILEEEVLRHVRDLLKSNPPRRVSHG